MMFICSAMAMESRRNLNREEVEDCILQMAQGDKDALARIYEMTHAAVYGFSLSILRNAQDAEDVLQETYLQLYHHAPAYRPNGNPMPYLFTIAKNFSLMKLRDRNKTQQMPEDDLLYGEDSTLPAEDRHLLNTLMQVLSEEERQIVMLHCVAGFKHREIGQVTGLPLSTVLSKYHRAIGKLRKQLEEGESSGAL